MCTFKNILYLYTCQVDLINNSFALVQLNNCNLSGILIIVKIAPNRHTHTSIWSFDVCTVLNYKIQYNEAKCGVQLN